MAKKKQLNFYELLETEFGDYHTKKDLDDREKIVAIPTGALSLDISTGVGGIPLGRCTELYGKEAGGKTTLALEISNNAIKMNRKVLYIDAENTLDLNLAEKLIENFDEETFIFFQPKLMEDSLKLAELGIASGDFGLVVLDSIGSLAPKKVLDDEITDSNVALLSRMLTVFLQRNMYSIRSNNVAFLGINQIRDKIGSYLSDVETPGGHLWKHNASIRIQLNRMADIEQGDQKIGINSKFVIKKNKLAPPYRTFYIPIIFGEGIDSERDTIEFSTMLGILERRGPYYKFEDTNLGIGMDNAIKFLKENTNVLDKIREACYNSINKVKIEREEENG